MTVWWIAERLAMGTRGYLNHLLYRRRKLGREAPISRTDPFSDLLNTVPPGRPILELTHANGLLRQLVDCLRTARK
jgi:hypothetical protein